MKNKKALIIIIVIIILIILASTATLAFLYLKTDIFKSAEQVFWTYFIQNGKISEVFKNENIDEQNKFKELNTYTSNGNLLISVIGNNDTSQDINVETLTKYDKETKRTYSEGILKNGDSDLLKVSYINSADVYALKCEDVLQYYIGIKNSNLKDLAKKLGIEESGLAEIPDSTNIKENLLSNYELTESEQKHIKDTYTNIILQNISQENYTKLGKNQMVVAGTNYNCNTYELALDGEKIKQIIVNCLENLKDDQIILSILNRFISTTNNNFENNNSNTMELNINSTIDEEDNSITLTDYTNAIEELIADMQELSIDNVITITIYENNGNLRRTVLDISDIMTITIDMSITSSAQTVNMTIEGNKTDNMDATTSATSSMKINLSKLNVANEITNTIEIIPDANNSGQYITLNTTLGRPQNNTIMNSATVTINDTNSKTITATYDKTIKAVNEVDEIMELKNSNAIILNNYEKEQLTPFIESTVTKIEEVLDNKIPQLGINLSESTTQDGDTSTESIVNTSNQIIDAIKIIGTAGVSIINVNGIDYTEILPSTIISMVPSIYMYSMAQDAIESTNNIMNNQSIQAHNSSYLLYEGEQPGSTVKILCDKIKNLNLMNSNSNEKISIQKGSATQINTMPSTGISSDEINQIKQEISAGKKYIIDFGYNSAGRIIAIGITEKQ